MGFLVIASFFIIFPIGIILGIIVITTRCCQNLRQIETGALFLVVSIARTKVSTTPAIVSASPGVISPWTSAAVTAFIA